MSLAAAFAPSRHGGRARERRAEHREAAPARVTDGHACVDRTVERHANRKLLLGRVRVRVDEHLGPRAQRDGHGHFRRGERRERAEERLRVWRAVLQGLVAAHRDEGVGTHAASAAQLGELAEHLGGAHGRREPARPPRGERAHAHQALLPQLAMDGPGGGAHHQRAQQCAVRVMRRLIECEREQLGDVRAVGDVDRGLCEVDGEEAARADRGGEHGPDR
eukprot:CAMPEP_0179929020 /NCGR_PEP_ID=MMETSP0983-20121128/9187_1 /TAXON_ID=483367 /ORGANISM="non described non described, Strain CCMP 2436" /LENGTH=219 /DNA_ID=CAMNT_0021832881 /DNA_START=196 /DNA_END=852 /DNA_ORIENTATION=+